MKKTVQCQSVPCRLTEATAKKVERLAKDHKFQRKAFVVETKDIEQAERTDISVITSDTLDRDNEIVLPEGIELDDFRANPVILYDHDQAHPCGKALWVKPDGNKLLMKTHYPPRPSDYEGEWLPDKAWALTQTGILKGKSIGFLPLSIREPSPEELERYPKCERVIDRSLLLEVSCVTVPSNPDSLIEAINKGLIKVKTVKSKKQGAGKEAPLVQEKKKPNKTLRALEGIDPNQIVKSVLRKIQESR